MFDKKMKIDMEEFKKIIREIEKDAQKEQEQRTQELKIKYFTLKENHEELEKNYIKATQENDILRAKIQELQQQQEEQTNNTLKKFDALDKF